MLHQILKLHSSTPFRYLLQRLASNIPVEQGAAMQEHQIDHTSPSMEMSNTSSQRPHKPTIILEGNIAVGKTTFLEYFKTKKKIFVVDEPVQQWQNLHGINIMEKMYEDPARWSMSFQTYVQLTMCQAHTKPIPRKYDFKVMERSIYSAKHVFAQNMNNMGLMTDMDYHILTEWFKWLIENKCGKYDLIVYLQAPPEVCYQRLQKRSRKEESNITLDYLQKLHDLYEDWLINTSNDLIATEHLLVISDTSENHEDLQKYFDLIIRRIEEKRNKKTVAVSQ